MTWPLKQKRWDLTIQRSSTRKSDQSLTRKVEVRDVSLSEGSQVRRCRTGQHADNASYRYRHGDCQHDVEGGPRSSNRSAPAVSGQVSEGVRYAHSTYPRSHDETAIVAQLSEQTTIARIQADRDPNRWTLLDPPRIDERPVNKKFSRNGALGAIVGLIAGFMAIFPIQRLAGLRHR